MRAAGRPGRGIGGENILSGGLFIQEVECGLDSEGWAGHRHCEGGSHGFLGRAVGVLCPGAVASLFLLSQQAAMTWLGPGGLPDSPQRRELSLQALAEGVRCQHRGKLRREEGMGFVSPGTNCWRGP